MSATATHAAVPPTPLAAPQASRGVALALGQLVLLLLLTTSSATVNVILGLLAVRALSGPVGAIHAVVLATIVKLLHPDLVPQTLTSSLLAWGVLLAAGLRILPAVRSEDARLLGLAWLFALLAATLSFFTSPQLLVSLMKAATFAWALSTLFIACRLLSDAELARLKAWLASLAAVVVALSALTLLDPALAFARNGTGLQGITTHPQTLAILTAPLAAFGLSRLVLYGAVARLPWLALTATSWVVLILTEARTGVFAAAAGAGVALAVRLWSRPGTGRAPSRGRIVVFAMLVIALAASASGRLGAAVDEFLLKRSDGSSLADAFRESRGAAIEDQWRNFLDRPLAGHGFGVNPEGGPRTEVVEFAGIPVSAPVEKGFVATAVLEETGILGGLLLLAVLLQMARCVWRCDDPCWIAVFVACLATNFGEATLLSPGGPGLLLWCPIALAVTLGRRGALPSVTTTVSAAATQPFPNLMR